jgi:hypothetical protein
MNKRSADVIDTDICKNDSLEEKQNDSLKDKYKAFQEKLERFKTDQKINASVSRIVEELKEIGGSDMMWFTPDENAVHFSYKEERLEAWKMEGIYGFRGVERWYPLSVQIRVSVPPSDLENYVRDWLVDNGCCSNVF